MKRKVTRIWNGLLAVALLCAGVAAAANPLHAQINSMNLGAQYNSDGSSILFRVYSSQATQVSLYLYSAGYGAQESAVYPMTQGSDLVWQNHSFGFQYLKNAGITGAVYYAAIAHGDRTGPIARAGRKGRRLDLFRCRRDANGNRFNPNKLLLDPYAREISQDPLNPQNPTNGAIFGFRRVSPDD